MVTSLRMASQPAAGNQRNPSPGSTPVPTLDDLLGEATWLEWRSTALRPQISTDLVTTDQTRAEFIEGARMLRLDAPGRHVLPHQLLVADTLNAGAETTAVLVPRRSSKTTSVLVTLLGRCQVREDYLAAITLTTTASKTSDRFRQDVVAPIVRRWPGEGSRPMHVYLGKGSERLQWAHGSMFAVRTPNGDAFRSDAYDAILVDESGEATPEQGEDLNGAIYPSFDTRDGAQAIFAGTAGKYRKGLLLWEALTDPAAAKLAYAFADDTTADELAAWEPSDEHPIAHVRELVELTHPGVHAGLTTLEKVRARYDKLGPVSFAREYGGIFGQIGEGAGVISAQRWLDHGEDTAPTPPERIAIGVMPSFTGRSASIVAAWRDESGRACGYLLDHRPGTTWLAEAGATLARRHDTPLVFDKKSSDMRVEVEAMERMSPRPRLEPQGYDDVTAAHALLVKEINNGNARHFRQPAMDEAARVAVRRTTGPNAWALGRPPRDAEADISPLEAWALALRYFDENPYRTAFAPIMGAAQ